MNMTVIPTRSLKGVFFYFIGFGLLATFPIKAWAWGERGHHIVGFTAARLIADYSDKEAKKSGLDQFFRVRAHQFGHLSNIPDISWRNPHHQSQGALGANAPTHYVDLELLTTNSTQDKNAFLADVLKIPLEYQQLKKSLVTDGEKPLTGISQKNQKRKSFRLFFEIGTAPWRIQELYEGMRSAFACAKEKERVKVNHSEKGSKKEVWNMPLLGGTHPLKSPELYTCQKQQTRLEALSAAIAMGGVMGHFVGDLAQPFHTTVNFDGWLTGNGKIHEYFESSIVDELSPALESIVELRARSPHLQSLFIKKFQFDEKETTAAVRFSLVLASDSWNLLDEVIALDKKYAIVNASSKPMSHIESEHSSGKPKPSESKIPPQRLPASNKKILETFEPLIVERLAIASKALALLWYHAWISGGRPQLADVNSYEIPYALDVPFLWPSYDPEALNHSAKIEK